VERGWGTSGPMGPTERRGVERRGSRGDASSDRKEREKRGRGREMRWIREGGTEEDTRRRVIEL